MFGLLAQQSAPSSGPGGMLGMFAPMVLVFAVFYFLLIRPQQKQQKKLQQQIGTMRKGDAIVTRSGIHGRVSQLNDATIMLEVANNVQIKVNKDQVALVQPPAE
ncbi:MAG: preprotein translocase subunit YajC [Deltaproteobacteria bacterium]|nr:preprotein translocase subunit YajC [Deltaproteobacteria bacterium]